MTDKPKAPLEPLQEGGVKTPDATSSPPKNSGMAGEAAPGGVRPGERNGDGEGGIVGEG